MSLNLIKANNLTSINKINHGFITRENGVSMGDFASLNFGYKTGDNLQHVAQNYQILCKFLGISKDQLIIPNQTHSNNVIYVKNNQQKLDNLDAVITDNKNLTLAVLTADCAPILLYGEGFIAAIHAGWRGAFSGIISNTVNLLGELGVKAENILAAIFPTIAAESYEVDANFRAEFLKQRADNNLFFTQSLLNQQKYQFDLIAYNIKQLKNSGIKNIESVAFDNFANPDKFFSYRYATKNAINTGRHLTFISFKNV